MSTSTTDFYPMCTSSPSKRQHESSAFTVQSMMLVATPTLVDDGPQIRRINSSTMKHVEKRRGCSFNNNNQLMFKRPESFLKAQFQINKNASTVFDTELSNLLNEESSSHLISRFFVSDAKNTNLNKQSDLSRTHSNRQIRRNLIRSEQQSAKRGKSSLSN